MSESPLHVQVAEALGWTNLALVCPDGGWEPDGNWGGIDPLYVLSLKGKGDILAKDAKLICPWPAEVKRWPCDLGDAPLRWAWIEVPRFDTDWSATGPLIEKYGITVSKSSVNNLWTARQAESVADWGIATTPLAAVCSLILRLAKEGKL